jgi:hypothetical protein
MEDRADPWIPVLDKLAHAVIIADSSGTYKKNARNPGERKGHAMNVARRII